jgi:hypothetical protein
MSSGLVPAGGKLGAFVAGAFAVALDQASSIEGITTALQ